MQHRDSTGRRLGTVLGAAALSVLLAACSSSADEGAAGGDDATVSVVASTNVWGEVAKAVGGDAVKVTSLISQPSVDPHSFEASSSTLLAVSKADLVIENGGGYDDFMDRMVESSSSKAAVLNAVDISGRAADAGAELNEHVWYDLPSVGKVADAIAEQLGDEQPAEAERFTARAAAFTAQTRRLTAQAAQLRKQVAGERIGITEPVPLYLTEAAGLVDATPPEFSEAVEEGDDVSPRVLQETLDLYAQKKVVALVYNEQTSGPVTDKVLDSARKAGIPVVPVRETLPAGTGYVRWMQQNLTALGDAVGRP
jgi:zinc/manganese transport system substrate-binding protein